MTGWVLRDQPGARGAGTEGWRRGGQTAPENQVSCRRGRRGSCDGCWLDRVKLFLFVRVWFVLVSVLLRSTAANVLSGPGGCPVQGGRGPGLGGARAARRAVPAARTRVRGS